MGSLHVGRIRSIDAGGTNLTVKQDEPAHGFPLADDALQVHLHNFLE
jgi:hypothetical protein